MAHSKTIITVLLLVLPCSSFAEKVLNIFNWSDFIPPKIVQQFETETGITVHISEYNSDEMMYAKLKSNPNIGYDIIFPTTDYIDKMRHEHMLHRIHHNQLKNFNNLNRHLLNKSFDPHNRYSIPYLWGTTGLVINKAYYSPAKIRTWNDLWKSKFKNKILMLNDMQDVFAVGMLSLGYSINDKNPTHIKQAYLKLRKLLPNIKLFNSSAVKMIYVDEDATIGMSWSDHAYLASQENKQLMFTYPKEGVTLQMDNIAIPLNAPHLENAYRFIDFLLRPKVAANIAMAEGASSPNLAARNYLSKKYLTNKTINPPANALKKGEFPTDLGHARQLYAKYWQALKIGG